MPKREPLKAIVIYDPNSNEYSISAHNQDAKEAHRVIKDWNTHPLAGCLLILLNQTERHRTDDPQACRTCRDAAAQSEALYPQARFVRRNVS